MRKKSGAIAALLLVATLSASAQVKKAKKPASPPPATQVQSPKVKKYPSLLWEITGNGLSRPSYLFGTMHVSDKMVFHLGDSFYNAIKSADVVALETNPETWQEDYSHSIFLKGPGNNDRLSFSEDKQRPNDNLHITSFAVDTYEEVIKAALAMEPSMINGMLYRTYGSQHDDFEEDTFLDMYIFQTGKKLGKKLTGVENFQASEKLVMEAYRDMAKDKNKRKKSYDYESMLANPKKLEDAYRKGDLDLLDSLENLSVVSDAFQEKFLYKRNEIQANSIDTIIKKASLFVGVGAAHLPGERGVIEMLRSKGYTLRPVSLDDRNSTQKETIDKLKYTNSFVSQTAKDGLYKVAVPGDKFYRFTEWSGLDVVQYADLVNGAYYLVTRIKTNGLAWGHNADVVYHKTDSLLYENIPGKILKKTPITRNGYKGLDITNRTRRGDIQRYQVFITPFEVVIFKISGNGDFVNSSDDTQQFFSSIQLTEYNTANWQTWQPATGGFSISVPHTPSLLRDNSFGKDRLEYATLDKTDGNDYTIMKMNVHNYSYLEEDTFELNLMQESYAYSSFIDKQLSHRFTKVNGYPAMESTYRHKDGTQSTAKFIIRGPVYYVVAAHYKNNNANVRRFLESFSITPFVYPVATQYRDTTLRIIVTTPVYDTTRDRQSEIAEMIRSGLAEGDDDISDNLITSEAQYKSKFIGNDTTGEKIFVSSYRAPTLYYHLDSTDIWKQRESDEDSMFIIKMDKRYKLPDGTHCRELQYNDTGSSRTMLAKVFFKNGNFLTLITVTDTLGKRSEFLEKFFATCTSTDSLNGPSPYTRKTPQFVSDLFSKDSVVAKRALKNMYEVEFDSLDVSLVKQVIDSVNWDMRGYMDIKKHFISTLGSLNDSTITPYLQQLYWKIKDTTDFQNAILTALLSQYTTPAFTAFKDLVLEEPPIVDDDNEYSSNYPRTYYRNISNASAKRYHRPWRYNPGRWNELYDSLSLTKTIFPDILQLANIDDYKNDILSLTRAMVDSNYLKGKDYETYFSKIYIDAKQLLRKQKAREDKSRLDKAGKKGSTPNLYSDMVVSVADESEDEEGGNGNSRLDKYASLLIPFREKNPGVQNFFEQLMQTQDKKLLYNTSMLLLRNNVAVPDSVLAKYAKLESYRTELYSDLKAMNKLDKFPATYKNQLDMVKSQLRNSMRNYEKLDTIIYIDKLPITYKDKKGYVYFFKYRKMRDDNTWMLATVGMQPQNLNEIDLENDDFTFTTGNDVENKLDPIKPVKEQLQKMLKEMLYAKRPSAASFYDTRSLTTYKKYLSEMVKNKRYKD